MSDQWLSIVEYARTYNVSDMTVRRRIKTGKLQAVLREGKYFIPVQAETPWRSGPTQNQVNHWEEPQVTAAPKVVAQSIPRSDYRQQQQHADPMLHTSSYVSDHGRQDQESSFQIPQQYHLEYKGKTVSVSGDKLLHFCGGTLGHMRDALRQLDDYKTSLDALKEEEHKTAKAVESSLRADMDVKDREMKQLRQQVADLEMLVKVMDKKMTLQQV